MSGIEDKANNFIDNILKYGFFHYKDFLLGLVVGLIFALLYNRFTGEKKLIKSYERIIEEKEKHNTDLKRIVYDRLKDVKVDDNSLKLFSRIKKFFK